MLERVVLVVEDDEAILALLVDLLREEFAARVVVAGDGGAALERARARRPDLVLLDLLMPGVDGLEFCRRLRGEPELAEVPVVALTAWGPREAVRERALAAGCAAVLYKPFDIGELLSVLARWLPLRR